MMLPVSRFKGHQPFGMVTVSWPSLMVSGDLSPPWPWLTGPSGGLYSATPHLVLHPPAHVPLFSTAWPHQDQLVTLTQVPEPPQFIQWERPAMELVPVLPPLYCCSTLPPPPPPPPLSKTSWRGTLTEHKLVDGWISPEELGVFQRREKLLLTNQIARSPRGHASRDLCLLSSRPPLPGTVRGGGDGNKKREAVTDSSSSPVPLQLLPAHPSGRVFWEGVGPVFPSQFDKEAWLVKEVWPITIPTHLHKGAWLKPFLSWDSWPLPPLQIKRCVFRPAYPSQLSTDGWPVSPLQMTAAPHMASRLTLLTNFTHQKRGRRCRGGFGRERKECVSVSLDREEGEEEGEEGRTDIGPVASTPVPGSPWCVVWTGDDRVFFFNPTIHLSVWDRPCELIGQDINHIIEDPPHKRKRTSTHQNSSSHPSFGHHGDDDEYDEDGHNSKKNRLEEPMSLVQSGEGDRLLPLELRIAHFRDMMLERGVSAFSSWEKELHKMVFDSRYLLLTSDQRKKVFEQFVKSRMKEEYKEKKNKLLQAKEEFKKLLEEAKITSRSSFKEFYGRYHGDQRFCALNRKKEQEVLFNHYITSLKRRDKENRVRLRKMR